MKSELNFKKLVKTIIISVLVFLATNIMFLINFELVGRFLDVVAIDYIQNDSYIVNRVFNSVISYVLYTYMGFRNEIFVIYTICLIIAFFAMILEDTSIIGAAMVNLVLMLLLNPSIQNFYFVFISPIIFLWLSHDISHKEKGHTLIDFLIHLGFIIIMKVILYQIYSVINVWFNVIFLVLLVAEIAIFSNDIKKK